MNLQNFSHLRLSRFNFLTVQGIYAERLPVGLFIHLVFFKYTKFGIHSITKTCQLKRRFLFNLQASDKYVFQKCDGFHLLHSNGRYGLNKFYPALKITLKWLQGITLFKDFEIIFAFSLKIIELTPPPTTISVNFWIWIQLQTLAQSDSTNPQLIFKVRVHRKTKYKQCQNITKQCFINVNYIYTIHSWLTQDI